VGATTTDLDEVQATLDGRLAGDTAPASEAPGGAERRFGRRALLVGGGLVGAAAVVGGVAALTGRGSVAVGPGSGERARAGAARDARGTMGEGAERLRMFTWQSYIDPTEDGVVGTVDRFVAATGIEMTYDEGFNDNLEFFAREIEPYLGTGRPTNHDLVVPSYWMAARLEHLGWLEPLPVERIPNRVNLEARYLAQTWDYGAVYNLPWQGGITGIAYDPALTGRELRSVMDLFDPAFRGRVGMLKEMHDSVGMTMLGLGLDPSRVDEDGAYRAIERLARATAEGQFRAFTGNEYMRSLESGDFVACLAWSIDVQQVQTNRPEIRFVIPEEGALGWYDTMVIPKGAANGHAAAAWMDFVYDPVQAAQISLWVQGLSPVRGVRDELLRLGEDGVALAESPLMFPSDEETARLHVFPHLPDDVDARIVDRFLKVVGG
jgi:spermidine/putrescine transport system substrate-binding protein